jgi:hypothetical protein
VEINDLGWSRTDITMLRAGGVVSMKIDVGVGNDPQKSVAVA